MFSSARAFYEDVGRTTLILLTTALSACLLPPDGEPSPSEQSPALLFDEVSPRVGVLFVSAGDEPTDFIQDPDGRCQDIRLRVPGISDPDSDTLLLRLVANNEESTARIIDEDPERTDDNGDIPPYMIQFDPRDHFGETVSEAARLGPRLASLTLFITDGVAWSSTSEQPPEDDDFGEVLGEGNVTRVDWTLFFTKDRNETCPS
ncbi:MAG: hypothetical protein AAGD10_12480 [Myxococcota bacterium]